MFFKIFNGIAVDPSIMKLIINLFSSIKVTVDGSGSGFRYGRT